VSFLTVRSTPLLEEVAYTMLDTSFLGESYFMDLTFLRGRELVL
jgi:hypothetical protein